MPPAKALAGRAGNGVAMFPSGKRTRSAEPLSPDSAQHTRQRSCPWGIDLSSSDDEEETRDEEEVQADVLTDVAGCPYK